MMGAQIRHDLMATKCFIVRSGKGKRGMTMIFYFTGTGNSLYAAQYLSHKLDESLISIAAELNSGKPLEFNLSPDEKVGFVYPVYAWQPPYMVINFVKALKFKTYHNNYLFSVSTCGDEEGYTTRVLNKSLRRKGLKLNSAFSLVMPNNYMIGSYNLDSEAEVEKKLTAAEDRLAEISSAIKTKQDCLFDTVIGSQAFKKSYITNYFFKKSAMDTKKFHATDNCTACGLCAEICNTKNIVVDSKPLWGNNCVQCFACINRCPEAAIQYGKQTQLKGRYINPKCKFPD
jgi:ferredoxin/flavodoxin